MALRFVTLLAVVMLSFGLVSGVASAKPPATEAFEITLAVGENRTLSAQGVKSYSEGSGEVIEVRLTPDDRDFVVVGKRAGQTTLLLIGKDGKQTLYNVAVFARPMDKVGFEVAELLADDTGLRIRRVGPRLFIEGGVSTDPELRRISQIAALYPGQVESLVVLGGTAAERKHNVRLDVLFVQLSRSRDFRVGISWPGGINAPVLAARYDLLKPGFVTATAQIIDQPLLGLDLMQFGGWARVLKHSTVITANGVKASFSSGGEQNFRVASGLQAQLAQVTFGTNVKVLPRYDPSRREIQVEVAAEISDLTAPGTTATDLPGRSLTNLETQVTLKLGQALVLSGIHTTGQRASNGGLPGLSQIPIIGALFGSHSRSNEMVDGALVLIPSVIDSVARTRRKVVDEFMETYRNFGGSHKQVKLPLLDSDR